MEINDEGSITAPCPNCESGASTFEWRSAKAGPYGVINRPYEDYAWKDCFVDYRLFRCAGCGRGALGVVVYGPAREYPGTYRKIIGFSPVAASPLPLPKKTPSGIVKEYREAERCLALGCLRAAAGLFRSVLDKTMRANGYKLNKGTRLEQEINMAAADGAITPARRKKAQEEVRVLGNDVLHDEWHEIPEADVEAAKHYTQRILEDFYDDRPTVLFLLRQAKRVPDEDKKTADPLNGT
jgi:hypothetical protein